MKQNQKWINHLRCHILRPLLASPVKIKDRNPFLASIKAFAKHLDPLEIGRMRKSSTLFLSVLVGFLCIHSSHGIPRAWTWLNGDSIVNPIGVYGTAGVPTGVETPGSRRSACTAYDPTFREFYVFGGFGQTNTTSAGGTIRSWRLEPGDEIIFHFFSCFQIGFLPSRSAILPGKLTSSCVIVIKDPSCVSHDFWRRNTGFMSDFWKFDAATNL
jgi:hypothetical protein